MERDQWTSCYSCDLNFYGNMDAFINHMSEQHAEDKIQCAICQEICDSGLEYSMHYIYNHTENGKNQNKVLTENETETFSCPLCAFSTKIWSDFAQHLNKFHSIEAGSATFHNSTAQPSVSMEPCPVCSVLYDAFLLNDHVNSHFDECNDVDNSPNSDYQLALELERQEMEARRKAEEKEFHDLQKEYGMDEQGSYKQQGTQAFESAYNKGQITLGQLYNEKLRLQINQNEGIEEANYAVKGLIEKVRELSRRCADILDTYTCSAVDYYGSSPADFGFGCGYRNIQMMISSLKQCEPYKKALFGSKNLKKQKGKNSVTEKNDGRYADGQVHVPSIPKIQRLIEDAWNKGFDAPGRDQLNGKLTNTKKWIGATEACVVLTSFKIRAAVVDFRAPSGPNGTHPQLLKWVYEYFKEKRPFTPPLYFQHQGHSRTIVGVERTRSGHFNLLLFDPSVVRTKMQKILKTTDLNAVKMLRKSLADLKKPQFQIVYVKGLMENENEFQRSKATMDVTRIPP